MDREDATLRRSVMAIHLYIFRAVALVTTSAINSRGRTSPNTLVSTTQNLRKSTNNASRVTHPRREDAAFRVLRERLSRQDDMFIMLALSYASFTRHDGEIDGGPLP